MYRRAFGQDAALTAQYVKTVVETMNESGIGCVLKHFPGYGSNGDTHTGLVYDSPRLCGCLKQVIFLPFAAGIEAGAGAVLVSHNVVLCMGRHVSRLPVAGGPTGSSGRNWGFEGVIMTDELSMGAITDFSGDGAAAVLAVLAGNDLLCCTKF